jgi:predicted nucleic acid-binding protein
MLRSVMPSLDAKYVAKPKLSVVDVFVAVSATRHGREPVYTFDNKLARQMPGCAELPA